jgi:cyclase
MSGVPQPSLQRIADGVHAWIGVNGDSNAGAIETPDGLIVIDAQQNERLGRSFRARLESALGRPVTTLINTHFHLDHTAGNVAFADVPIIAHERTLAAMRHYLGPDAGGMWTVAETALKMPLFFGSNIHELVRPGSEDAAWFAKRLSGPDYDTITLRAPSQTFADRLAFHLPGDELRAEYRGPAHCDGDIVVSLAKAKIAFLGDLMFFGRFPWFGDCDLDGWIACLDRVLTLDLVAVVPGHGPMATLRDVADFRNLLASLRDAVSAAIRSGASEDAAAHEVGLPDYAAMPRYAEWMSFNVRATYRYLKVA